MEKLSAEKLTVFDMAEIFELQWAHVLLRNLEKRVGGMPSVSRGSLVVCGSVFQLRYWPGVDFALKVVVT